MSNGRNNPLWRDLSLNGPVKNDTETHMDQNQRNEYGNEFPVLDEDQVVESRIWWQVGQLIGSVLFQMLS